MDPACLDSEGCKVALHADERPGACNLTDAVQMEPPEKPMRNKDKTMRSYLKDFFDFGGSLRTRRTLRQVYAALGLSISRSASALTRSKK